MSCNCQSDKFDLGLVRTTTRADEVFNIGDLDDDHPHSQTSGRKVVLLRFHDRPPDGTRNMASHDPLGRLDCHRGSNQCFLLVKKVKTARKVKQGASSYE